MNQEEKRENRVPESQPSSSAKSEEGEKSAISMSLLVRIFVINPKPCKTKPHTSRNARAMLLKRFPFLKEMGHGPTRPNLLMVLPHWSELIKPALNRFQTRALLIGFVN